MLLSSTNRARIATTLCLTAIFAAAIAFAPSWRQFAKTAAVQTPQALTNDDPVTPAAGVITVNSTTDVANGADGLCTLREAITAANTDTAAGATAGECAAGSGDDTINFSVNGTINLATPLPDIASSMLLTGPGASLLTIRRSAAPGTPDLRIFNVTLVSPGAVTFFGLTIANGKALGNGAGILNVNTATVNLTNCTVTGNFADGNGGGILNGAGILNITNSTVTENTASHPTTGGSNRGNGGGIFNNSGTVNLLNSTVSQNSAFPTWGFDGGGGIANGGAGTINIVSSTLSNNGVHPLGSSSALFAHGGGIANLGAGGVNIINSTLSGNSAYGGGGIGNVATGIIRINSSTLSNNTGDATGGIRNNSLDGGLPQPPPVLIRNSIVAQNIDTTGCPDVSGPFSSQGHNFVGNGGCSFPSGGNGDQVGNGGVLTINARLAGRQTTEGRPRPSRCCPARRRSMPETTASPRPRIAAIPISPS